MMRPDDTTVYSEEKDYTIYGRYCPLTLPPGLTEGETYVISRNWWRNYDSVDMSGHENGEDCGYEA